MGGMYTRERGGVKHQRSRDEGRFPQGVTGGHPGIRAGHSPVNYKPSAKVFLSEQTGAFRASTMLAMPCSRHAKGEQRFGDATCRGIV